MTNVIQPTRLLTNWYCFMEIFLISLVFNAAKIRKKVGIAFQWAVI
ncbi:hypothetical protein EVA_14689 [gut metagenome]|uniref:Uncharacterized protein n=1 Tax=gut metagenome TaxID=749906 RepID=J9FQI1_9ZZZZ